MRICAFSVLAAAAVVGSGAPLVALPSLSSSGGALSVGLSVVAARLSSGTDFSVSTRAYAWASGGASGGPALSGPTLRVRAGDTLTLALSNNLGPDFGPEAAWPVNY